MCAHRTIFNALLLFLFNCDDKALLEHFSLWKLNLVSDWTGNELTCPIKQSKVGLDIVCQPENGCNKFLWFCDLMEFKLPHSWKQEVIKFNFSKGLFSDWFTCLLSCYHNCKITPNFYITLWYFLQHLKSTQIKLEKMRVTATTKGKLCCYCCFSNELPVAVKGPGGGCSDENISWVKCPWSWYRVKADIRIADVALAETEHVEGSIGCVHGNK